MFSDYINDLRCEFHGYNIHKFVKDLFAGLTVCAVALPLALAFGVSSGADASAGLITAIIAGIIISVFSGASYQISGPTGAMAAILIPISVKLGLQGIFVVCFISGILLLFCGFLKLGKMVSFIPSSVVTGFTSGIAIIIIMGQLDNFLGIKTIGENQIEKFLSIFSHGVTINMFSVVIALGVIMFMVLYPKRLNEVFPSSLAAIIFSLVLNKLFIFPVTTIGEIPKTLILPNRLDISLIKFADLNLYILPAISIACLGMVESLLCGTCGGKLKDEKMNADREIISQGIGNIIIPFFGGVPATAAIARTSVAIKAGCQTRLTGIIHGIGLIISMLFLGSLMAEIPLCALSGVLMVTAWRMNEWENIRHIFKNKYKSAIILFIITMISTVIFDLTIAIALGVISAMVIYVVKSSKITVNYENIDLSRLNIDESKIEFDNEKCGVVYITGPLFFMTAEKIYNKLKELYHKEIIILSMRGVPHADVADVQLLSKYCEEAKKEGKQIIFSSVQPNVMKVFKRAGLVQAVGSNSFYFSADKALHSLIKT